MLENPSILGESRVGLIACLDWVNTTIIMDVADPNYIDTLAKGRGVTGDMKTSDGGKTWTIDTIHIPQFTFGASS